MKLLGTLSVFPALPQPLTRLNELAYNLWWTWSPEAQALFHAIDPDLWESTIHNPVKLLHTVSGERLRHLATDAAFLAQMETVLATFDAYMHPASVWFDRAHAEHSSDIIAYFSAEFGLHEALPIYSGGLGVLAGDHCKSASDLGLPFVGVGFLYPQGYFSQRISEDGVQEAIYTKLDFADLPATPALDANGNEVLISVQLPGRNVYAKVWRLQIGRIPLYLMDTDVGLNTPDDRDLSARLYSGDMDLRVAQEVVLGIGGVRALRALGIHPTVFHMNEGHAAFLSLERVRELVQEQRLSFYQAQQIVAASGVFTTHTPVPAGNDAFPFDIMDKFFRGFWEQMGLDREGFMNLARWQTPWGERFSMTVLALRFAAHANGVSALHGQVARAMWANMWPDLALEEVPITHVTNGVHTGTWLAPTLGKLYDQHLGADWREEPDLPAAWEHILSIPDADLWDLHQQLRRQTLDFLRARVAQQRRRYGEAPAQVAAAFAMFNPNAFTIGFARRFATYKRATLIFRDLERIHRLLSDPERPVQIVFAGKAHPADEPGKAFIQQVHQLAQTDVFAGKIVFIEDYDMNVARYLVSGVDLWLNNPRRPNEASGTSGQKAALNGIPNCSILDGWWDEGYNPSTSSGQAPSTSSGQAPSTSSGQAPSTSSGQAQNGWAIGEGLREREYKSEAVQDEADSASLYNILESEIIPAFFDRDERGIPARWLAIMKEAIRSCAPRFSMSRQVKDYVEQLYLPAASAGRHLSADRFAVARNLAAWKERMYTNWAQVRLSADRPDLDNATVGDTLTVEARVYLGAIDPQDVSVEFVWGAREGEGLRDVHIVTMTPVGMLPGGILRYSGAASFATSGRFGYGARVLPRHPDFCNRFEMGLVKWA